MGNYAGMRERIKDCAVFGTYNIGSFNHGSFSFI
jgi:hypothetical protein